MSVELRPSRRLGNCPTTRSSEGSNPWLALTPPPPRPRPARAWWRRCGWRLGPSPRSGLFPARRVRARRGSRAVLCPKALARYDTLTMQTRISSNGQVVLPGPIRRKLRLSPGDALDACVKSGQIVLTPRRARPAKATIGRDTVTGLPVLSAGLRAPQLSSAQVEDILSNLP